MGDWGKWCDVLLLTEDDGSERTKLTTLKRDNNHWRITALRSGGLLVEPQDIAERGGGPKVENDKVVQTVRDNLNMTYQELADELHVTKRTAQDYVKDAGDAIDQAATGPEVRSASLRQSHMSEQPGKTESLRLFSDVSYTEGPTEGNRASHAYHQCNESHMSNRPPRQTRSAP